MKILKNIGLLIFQNKNMKKLFNYNPGIKNLNIKKFSSFSSSNEIEVNIYLKCVRRKILSRIQHFDNSLIENHLNINFISHQDMLNHLTWYFPKEKHAKYLPKGIINKDIKILRLYVLYLEYLKDFTDSITNNEYHFIPNITKFEITEPTFEEFSNEILLDYNNNLSPYKPTHGVFGKPFDTPGSKRSYHTLNRTERSNNNITITNLNIRNYSCEINNYISHDNDIIDNIFSKYLTHLIEEDDRIYYIYLSIENLSGKELITKLNELRIKYPNYTQYDLDLSLDMKKIIHIRILRLYISYLEFLFSELNLDRTQVSGWLENLKITINIDDYKLSYRSLNKYIIDRFIKFIQNNSNDLRFIELLSFEEKEYLRDLKNRYNSISKQEKKNNLNSIYGAFGKTIKTPCSKRSYHSLNLNNNLEDKNNNPIYGASGKLFTLHVSKRFYNISVTKKKIIKIWKDYEFNLLKYKIITTFIIYKSLENFKEHLKKIIKRKKNGYVRIMFKIKSGEGYYRSLSYLQTVKIKNFNSDFDKLKGIFKDNWNIKGTEYKGIKISHIVYSYRIIEDKEISDSILISDKSLENKDVIKKTKIFGYDLPNTMDYTEWGEIIIDTESLSVIRKKGSKNLDYFVQKFDNCILVELKLSKQTILSFKDYINNGGDLSTFTREINNQKIVYINGEVKIKYLKKRTNFISPLQKESKFIQKFITMDIETKDIEIEDKKGGFKIIKQPYCISIYDGKVANSFYLLDYKDSKCMVESAIKSVMRNKYNGYNVYMHNFSYFDSIFLIGRLSSLTNETLRPIINEGRIINFPFKFSKRDKINFRDSYLLLPKSLRDLGKKFKVEEKGIFPYNFVNSKHINLDYNGKFPRIKFFDIEKVGAQEYINYRNSFLNKNWNLRNETIKYCEQDCITLYNIIDKFSKHIYSLFRVSIQKYPTLPSLTFATYRTKYLKDNKIPIIIGETYNNIKKAYTGGSVDFYKPIGENIKGYDVNSLYPTSMKENDMPVGTPIFFEGNILEFKNKPFGIFEVEIETPLNINVPILQLRTRINNCIKTVSPVGKWTGWYFSEELYNALKYGYKFKINKGYLFERANIFKEYIDFLYEIKKNSEIDSVDYIIAKMLQNSLYGRFGMNPIKENNIILSSEESEKFLGNKIVTTNIIQLDNYKELITFFPEDGDKDKIINVSVPISTVIAAYSRIFMSYYKNLKGYTLYYSDTDSIYLDKELEPKYVGKELGQFKLERVFERGIFLGAKMYGGVLKDKKDEYIKIKGYKNIIKFKELEKLLYKNSKLELTQEKWYRNIPLEEIEVSNEIYTLMVTESKRKLIYENNKLIDTKPININQ